ncbi:hypothetical protein pneo_cds_1010 [Pandoravirus neocaledonia]|uniref:Uncharacterized protein n=1 Tax=Pandoravirus neocaledonia TaxID=2107708 RepID=A0A2U7UDV1_9VIRU|nr:hypothetical protein pneo_cds_1010 [Pandoravirus neocaledonia]AVK76617.1 hypothetical protein pneo_cds_1010 [Pandoravirus neocaledonia]
MQPQIRFNRNALSRPFLSTRPDTLSATPLDDLVTVGAATSDNESIFADMVRCVLYGYIAWTVGDPLAVDYRFEKRSGDLLFTQPDLASRVLPALGLADPSDATARSLLAWVESTDRFSDDSRDRLPLRFPGHRGKKNVPTTAKPPNDIGLGTSSTLGIGEFGWESGGLRKRKGNLIRVVEPDEFAAIVGVDEDLVRQWLGEAEGASHFGRRALGEATSTLREMLTDDEQVDARIMAWIDQGVADNLPARCRETYDVDSLAFPRFSDLFVVRNLAASFSPDGVILTGTPDALFDTDNFLAVADA